jgi:hypothetical protein
MANASIRPRLYHETGGQDLGFKAEICAILLLYLTSGQGKQFGIGSHVTGKLATAKVSSRAANKTRNSISGPPQEIYLVQG